MLQHVQEYGHFHPNIIDQVVANHILTANILQPVCLVCMSSTEQVRDSAVVNISMASTSLEVHANEYPQVESNDYLHMEIPFEPEMDEMIEAIISSLFYLCIFSLVGCMLHENQTLYFNLCSIV